MPHVKVIPIVITAAAAASSATGQRRRKRADPLRFAFNGTSTNHDQTQHPASQTDRHQPPTAQGNAPCVYVGRAVVVGAAEEKTLLINNHNRISFYSSHSAAVESILTLLA